MVRFRGERVREVRLLRDERVCEVVLLTASYLATSSLSPTSGMGERYWAYKRFYEDLELTGTPSQTDIKKSFRRLALKWHPVRARTHPVVTTPLSVTLVCVRV
jgi:preprotein translocase subunit Sec63